MATNVRFIDSVQLLLTYFLLYIHTPDILFFNWARNSTYLYGSSGTSSAKKYISDHIILQQRHLSRLREFDLTQYSEFLRDLDGLVTAFENEKTAAGQWQVLAKIQLGLIAAQDIGDEKMATAQVHKLKDI